MDREAASADDDLAAAGARIDALRDQLSRIELQIVVVAPPDAVRRAARERAQDAARSAGRGALLDDTLDEVRATTLRTFARAAFSGTWAASQMAVSVASAQDRVAAVAAFEEAAIAAVAEDLVDDETLDILRATADHFASVTGMPVPMTLSTLGAPAAGVVRRPLESMLIIGAAAAMGALFGSASGSIAGIGLGIALIAVLARVRRQPEA